MFAVQLRSTLTELFLEKYLKKLTGRTDIEDALKRLDRLTQEEARMASAQLMKVTNTIDTGVREVADTVLVVDNRVAGVNERVANVDDKVASIDDRVKDVVNRVKAVDVKMAVVNDGAQYVSIYHRRIIHPTHDAPRCEKGHGSFATNS